MKKGLVQINKKEFLEWRFDDADDLVYLRSLVISTLLGDNILDINAIWKETGYCPKVLVKNIVPQSTEELEVLKVVGLEDEIVPECYEVEWL